MYSDEEKHATAPGSLERATFPDEDPGEKSLLRLIEERAAGEPQNGASGDHGCSRLDALDDVDEEDRSRFDQLTLRLGGNGF